MRDWTEQRRPLLLTTLLASLLWAGGCSSSGLHAPSSWFSAKKPDGAQALSAAAVAQAQPYRPAPAQDPPDSVDSVVASVDGNPITSRDVTTFNAAQTVTGAAPAVTPDDPNSKLKTLITQQLIRLESQKYADKVDDSDIDRMIAGIEDRNHMTDEQLREQLQSQGVSYAEFRANVRRQAEAMAMFQREVRDKIVIPDSEIKAYYKAHPEEFTVTDEKYQLAQILIAAPPDASAAQLSALQAKAVSVQKQAAKGADFAALARQYSDDDSKSKGGELGVFSAADLNDAIGAGIKKLKPGDVSKVIRTKYGFHIIKVEAHQMPGEVPLEQVSGQIREKLQDEKSKGDYQHWIDQDLVKEHYVETSD